MSVNNYRPHILILPEDDANRQLAIGFILNIDNINIRQVQVLPVSGGWRHVCDEFVSDYIGAMYTYTNRFMVLLIDFDNKLDRINDVQKVIPSGLSDRVFVLGTLTEPEELKRQIVSPYEAIGEALADDFQNGTHTLLSHELLKHNQAELDRLRKNACSKVGKPI